MVMKFLCGSSYPCLLATLILIYSAIQHCLHSPTNLYNSLLLVEEQNSNQLPNTHDSELVQILRGKLEKAIYESLDNDSLVEALENGNKVFNELDLKKISPSSPSRIKIINFLSTLDGVPGSPQLNDNTLSTFAENWESSCGNHNVKFEVCPGRVHPIKGVGLTLSYIDCIHRAYSEGADLVFFYRDYVVPFDSQICLESYQQHLMYDRLPEDAFVLLLGANSPTSHWRVDVSAEAQNDQEFVRLKQSQGTYGFALHREVMKDLAHYFSISVLDSIASSTTCNPDIDWYEIAALKSRFVYIVNPLLIDHQKKMLSNLLENRQIARSGESLAAYRDVFITLQADEHMASEISKI